MTARQYPEGTLLAFTRQDLVTFAVGLGAALALTLGEALVQLDSGVVEDWGLWARNLGVGFASAAGRYLLTELTQRGLRREAPPEPTAAAPRDILAVARSERLRVEREAEL